MTNSSNGNDTDILDEAEAWHFRDQQLAAGIVFWIALVGACCNWFIALTMNKLATLQNSFGKLAASQAVADAVHSTIFIVYYCPMVFFDIKSWQLQVVSKRFGHILLICYDICIFTHVFISLNRLAAIVFQFSYNRVFSSKCTKVYIAIAWGLAIIPSLYFNVYLDCTTLYMDIFWVFFFVPDCMYVVKIEFAKYLGIVLFIAAVDIVTICRVRRLKVSGEDHLSSDLKRRKELSFLKQAIFQAVIFVMELFTYFYIFLIWDNRWFRFCCTTVAWVSVHAVDGMVVVSLNTEFRVHLMKLLKKVGPKNKIYSYIHTGSVQHSTNVDPSSHGQPHGNSEHNI